MLFQMPGLNSLYYRYLVKQIMDNPPTKEDVKKLDNAYKKANTRMIAIFLGYLLPILVAFYFAINNLTNIYFIIVAFEIGFLIFNSIADNKYQKRIGSGI